MTMKVCKNLASIYLQLSDLLTENGFSDYCCKNLKKKEKLSFCWDLSAALMEKVPSFCRKHFVSR